MPRSQTNPARLPDRQRALHWRDRAALVLTGYEGERIIGAAVETSGGNMAGYLRCVLLMVLLLSSLPALLAPSPAGADLIATEEVFQAESDHNRLKALVERPEVAKQFELRGIPAKEAQARVDALTDEEVRALVRRIDALPAGGTLSTHEWLLLIIVILLLVIIV